MTKFNLQYGFEKENLKLGLLLCWWKSCYVTSLDSKLDSLTSFATKKLSFDFLLVDVDPLISPHFKLLVGVFKRLLHLGDVNKPSNQNKFPWLFKTSTRSFDVLAIIGWVMEGNLLKAKK
jgi:hypothetical protein